MKKHIFTGLFWALFSGVALGQDTLKVAIDPVVITDNRLSDDLQSVRYLSQQTLERSSGLLSDVLRYNSPLFFKENGYGMVASASFRGTTASQTAVIWNGININSQFNGQVDFNGINTNAFNQVAVKAGGGSLIYGSSAIGGSVHLNNPLYFDRGFSGSARVMAGSFNTYQAILQLKESTEKTSWQLLATRLQSENDYPYIGTDKENKNGAFYNQGLSADYAHQLSQKHKLSIHSNWQSSERHFSVILPTETPTKYRDFAGRNLVQLQSDYGKIQTYLKLAYLWESYQYYENIALSNHTNSEVDRYLAKYDLAYHFTDNLKLQTLLEAEHNSGSGNDILSEKRNVYAASLQLTHRLFSNLNYQIGLRTEQSTDFSSPVLYQFSLVYDPLKWLTLKGNVSKNYKIPSFNDMYWITGGNTSLSPEIADQYELSLTTKLNDFQLGFTAYFKEITDMIRWVPGPGLWRPENADRVNTKGIETYLYYHKNLGAHTLSFRADYTYTQATNRELDKQLTYTPFHQLKGLLEYQYNRWQVYAQSLFVGESYTRSDNDPRYILSSYLVNNLGASYRFGKNKPLELGIKMLNLTNTAYEVVELRPMPGRHFQMHLTFNF